MQWIDRQFGVGKAGVEKIRVPRGRPAAFWNAAIDAIRGRLLAGPGLPDRPTVPMGGGHGSIHLEARAMLCTGYLYAVAPPRRAYAALRLVGELDRSGGQLDRWHGKETRLSFAVWLEAQDVIVDGIDLRTAVVSLGDRWSVVLAALYELGRAGRNARLYYEQGVARCANGGPLVTVSTRSGLGIPVRRATPETELAWKTANAGLRDPDRAPRMLARLAIHVLAARLFIVLPIELTEVEPLWLQLFRWVHAVVNAPRPGMVVGCDATYSPHVDTIRRLCEALDAIQHFGGPELLDADARWPECFRPYRGDVTPRLDLLLLDAHPDHHAAFTVAYLLGVLIADKLMDPLQARLTGGPLGAGFDREAFRHLDGLLRTTRDAPNLPLRQERDRWKEGVRMATDPAQGAAYRRRWGMLVAWLEYRRATAIPLPHSAARLQLQRLFGELARVDERLAKRVAELMLDAPAQVPHPAMMCPACGGLAA